MQNMQEAEPFCVSVHAVTQEADVSSGTDSDDDIFQIGELTTIKGKQGKLLVVKLEFKDVDKNYSTILDCQLDTGATCNLITHHQLSTKMEIQRSAQVDQSYDYLTAQ